MPDQGEAKTKTIGFLPMDKVQTLQGWDEYIHKANKLSILITETQKAKNSVRDKLKQQLNESDDIDFISEGDRIRVIRVLRKQQQGKRTLDLSSSFREQPFGSSETNGDSAAQEVMPDKLDPVTERLLAIMREKTQRQHE